MRGFVWAGLVTMIACTGAGDGEGAEASQAPRDAEATTPAPAYEPLITDFDSAGVRIVESVRPVWRPGTGWRIDDEPTLVIGVEDGPLEYQFFRIGGAHRTSDGSLVISNAGSHQVRVYDVDGRFVRAMGRRGGGPGEFGQFSSMALWVGADETIHVSDGFQDRMIAYSAHGDLIRTYRLEATPEFPRAFPLTLLSDGSWLAWAPKGGGRMEGAPGTILESEFGYARYGTDGTQIRELFRQAGRPRLVHQVGSMIHYPYIPLTTDPLVVAVGAGFALWVGPQPEITLRHVAGTLRAVIRWHPDHQRLVSEVWDRFGREDVEGITNARDRQLYADLYARPLPLPSHVPVLARLLSDSDGNLWAERLRLPWDTIPNWDVFNPDGHWLGTVEVPRSLRLLDVGQEHVVARHRDEDGVERVHVYRLRKAS